MMKNREWYEDSIQSIICLCLPKVPKSNIRPAYQKTKLNNPFAVNHMDKSDPMKDGVKAVQNETDIIYFWLHFDPLDILATEVEINDAGSFIDTVIPFKLTITCYGADSMMNGIRLKAVARTPNVLNAFLNLDFVMTSEPQLSSFSEEFNEEWWERTDVDLDFSARISDFIDSGMIPALSSTKMGVGYSKSTSGKVAISEVSNGK